MFYQRRILISVLYFATASLASFASALVAAFGTAGALLLFASIVPIWIPLGRWGGGWLPVIASGALILYFFPSFVWQAVTYKTVTLPGLGFNTSFLFLLTCTLVISMKRLLADRNRDPA